MGDLSKNFSRSEFACKCGCGADDIERGVVDLLERIREFVGNKLIHIHSGVRCYSHNKACGGAHNSQHLQMKAADISVVGIEPKELARLIEENLNVGGLGVYPGFVHIDIRTTRARW